MTQKEILRLRVDNFLAIKSKKFSFTKIVQAYYQGVMFVLLIKKVSLPEGKKAYYSQIHVMFSRFDAIVIYNEMFSNTKLGFDDRSCHLSDIKRIYMDNGYAKLVCQTVSGPTKLVDFKMV